MSPEEADLTADVAATKIQAGYRGFRTRKMLKSRRKTPQYDQQVQPFTPSLNPPSFN